MRLRNIPGAREAIAKSPLTLETPTQCRGRWSERFGCEGPLFIEIGMGKGRFIMDMARLHPEGLYVGIEKYSSVLLRGLQKLEREKLPNVLFVRMDAEEITSVFDMEEVDGIYLNFSDPWPKDRHAKRRLPSGAFLTRYYQILKAGGRVEFKTDNRPLFDFAVDEAERMGDLYDITYVTYDLHADEEAMITNVMTEYEEKFSSMGNPIFKLTLVKK